MEVPESPVIGFANPPSTTESVRMKKKKLHKAKHTNELPSTTSTNGLESSPSPEDDESRPSKRKRDSESHKKKNNKKRREGEVDANEESTLQDTNQMSDEEEDQSPSKETRETEQNGTGEASLLQGSPEPTSDATPDSLLKKVRGYRIGGKNQQKVGFFIEEEVKALENFKVQFCNIHGVEGRTFDAMIQHSERGGDEWPVGTHICTKADFWNDIYALIPDRDRRSVYRFMRRHFQDTTQKAHDWTPEQDEELIRLHAQHGPKYAHIAKLLGRSDDDVTQRWKNRLQHRNTKRTGGWSETELRAFMTSLEEYRNLLITSSAEPEKAGKDIWEMELKSISWGSISNGMENSRTRQQCADKWRKISKNIMTRRQTVDPNAVFDPVEAAKKHHRWNGVAESDKSNVYVEDDDDDDDEETRIPSTTPAIIPKLEFAAEQQAVDLARVAREYSVESSPSRGDIQVDGSYSVEKTKKRKHTDAEVSDDDEDDDDAAPSSPISENSHSEVKKSREDKQERKRRKQEKKVRKRREAAEAAAAEGLEGEVPITPKEKKHKKHRKSEANGNEGNEAEPTESSKKKSKKEKKKLRKAAQEEGAGVDYTSDIESSMVV
ncbi:uncharacterized protein N7496_001158 [Penicillium cataractarum]|uniref:Uncharacterized protein n=1 Tax=Penicillium cataractarum TaxID=2100454 RepID=A0A9W9VVP6_9EURO|nr:uncharacterized protein N7496_001158 [Penicillium cataractarum]KAJ5390090.1 hypothetical protein N7496_001158 [Penicillium cataractarum]